MFAYVVTGSYPEYADKDLGMLVYHAGSKKDVAGQIARDGWKVKRVRSATMSDIQDFTRYEEVLKFVRSEADRKRAIDAENRRRAEIDAKLREEQWRREEDGRRKAAEEAHDRAISVAVGDLFSVQLEPGLKGNAKIAAICSKALLFFDQASVNKKDLFTAISIDFADFESQSSYPLASKLLSILVNELNEFLRVDEGMAALKQRFSAEAASVEDKINSIASRTHVFGGSGDGLLFSWLAANSAANQDGKAIESLEKGHLRQIEQVQRAADEAGLRQQLTEFRAKVAISMLLAACGKSRFIEINMPLVVEEYVLRMG